MKCWLIKEFRKELALNSKLSLTPPQENKNELPPQFWEYKKRPWYFTLTLKNFAGTQCCRNARRCSNIRLSQAARKREYPIKLQQKYEDDCVDCKSRKIRHENALSKQSMWAKLHAAKVLEETANVLCQQGQLGDLEKSLNLLDRMKPKTNDSD